MVSIALFLIYLPCDTKTNIILECFIRSNTCQTVVLSQRTLVLSPRTVVLFQRTLALYQRTRFSPTEPWFSFGERWFSSRERQKSLRLFSVYFGRAVLDVSDCYLEPHSQETRIFDYPKSACSRVLRARIMSNLPRNESSISNWNMQVGRWSFSDFFRVRA